MSVASLDVLRDKHLREIKRNKDRMMISDGEKGKINRSLEGQFGLVGGMVPLTSESLAQSQSMSLPARVLQRIWVMSSGVSGSNGSNHDCR